MTLQSLSDVLDRMPAHPDVNELTELFPTGGSLMSLRNAADRATLLLDIQDSILDRYGDIGFDPRHTVGFRHNAQTYLAAHYDWAGGIGGAIFVSETAREFALWNGLIAGEGLLAPNNNIGRAELLAAWILTEGGRATTADNILTRGIHNTCFDFTGYTYANVIDAFDVPDTGDENRPIDLDNPALLFFSETGDLTGCGYIRPLTPTTDPDVFAPGLAPLRQEWFAHPVGAHTDDGGFEEHDHDDGHNHNTGRRHEASWDIHIWFNLTTEVDFSATVPRIVVEPAGIPVVGHMMSADRIAAPPNVGRAVSTNVVDKGVCSSGEPSPGFYVDPAVVLADFE